MPSLCHIRLSSNVEVEPAREFQVWEILTYPDLDTFDGPPNHVTKGTKAANKLPKERSHKVGDNSSL
ncbi:unnamed protein product [Calypogeia fissa]